MENGNIRHYFEQYGSRIEAKRGSSICNPKLCGRYVYYLVDGIASLTSINMDGEEKDFIYFNSDTLLGFVPVLMQHYRKHRRIQEENTPSSKKAGSPFGIGTKTDCVFFRIDEQKFERLIEQDPDFLSYVMETVTYNYVAMVEKFQNMQEERASVRLYKWFLTFSKPENGYRIVPHGFTYAEIAKYLGMHPVTVSKLAADLKKQGVIEKREGKLVILKEDWLMENVKPKTENM